MTVCKILLADMDVEYGKALSNAISNLKNEFEITMVSLGLGKNGRIDMKISFQKYDLILLGGYPREAADSIFKAVQKNTAIAILSDDIALSLQKQAENETNHYWHIYKYSNFNDIVSELHYLAGTVAGKKSLARKSLAPELIGFYSISGGTGKSVISLGTSRELSRFHDKKVLYLCFEEMPATELFFGNHSQNRNIGDYLYYLFEKKNSDLCSRPGAFTLVDQYGVETFYPTMGRNDLNRLTQSEMICFLKVLSDSCRYDYIILDLRNDLSEDTLFLMNLCQKIILIQSDDPVSDYKTRKLVTYLEREGVEGFPGRTFLTVNRIADEYDDQEVRQDQVFNRLNKFYIENDGNSFRHGPGYMEIDINHAFGVGIKKITDVLLLHTSEER